MIQFLKFIISDSRRRGIVILSVALVSSVLLFSSCFFDRLLKFNKGNDATVTVKFDWTEVEGEKPNNMSLWFFPRNDATKTAVRRNVENVRNGAVTVKIPFGEYDVICVNNDPNRLEYRNEKNPYEFEVVIKNDQSSQSKTFSRADGGEEGSETRGEEYLPMGVWCGTATALDYVLETEDYQLELKPEAVAVPVDVKLTVKERFGDLKSMAGALFEANYIYKPFEKKVVESVKTIYFDMNINTTDHTITAAFQSFAHKHTDDCQHRMEFYCEMKNGIKYTYAYNIKEQLLTHRIGNTLKLENENFKLPVGQDFSFTIKDWGIIDVESYH